MRLLLVLAMGGLAAGQANAQGGPWNGGYIGVSGGLSGLAPDTSVVIAVARVGRPDADYSNTVYEILEGSATFKREVSSESTLATAAFVGMTFDEGSIVWGGELRLEAASIERKLSSGLLRWVPTGFLGRQATFPIPSGAPSGINPSTGILREEETFTSIVTMDYNVSLLGRLGVPLGDSILLSAIAGVSAAPTQMIISQSSEQFGVYRYSLPIPNSPQLSVAANSSATDRASAKETLWGPTVGALVEFRLDEGWVARADLIYTHYGELSLANSAGSAASFQPRAWSTSIGVVYSY